GDTERSHALNRRTRLTAMATTATDHALLIDGEHVETGSWTDITSPFSGERAMRDPLPAHERARILDATARLLEERQEEAARIICAEAGKPLKTARVE